MESVKNAKNKAFCHDCKKEIEFEGNKVKNGLLLSYKDGKEEIMIFKCNDCYKSNPALTNFRQCEVYSRIVGYLRPVQQWNEGKKKEFEKRKVFKVKN